MRAKFIIGLDIGGSGSRGVLLDYPDFREIARVTGGAGNPVHSGVAESVRVINRLISELRGIATRLGGEVIGIGAGVAGAGRESESRALAEATGAIIVTDVEAALAGGLMRTWGAVLISGTGSIAMSIAPDGTRLRAGGWGPLLGDEGSGYDIVIRGARAVMRSYDRRDPPTILSEMFLRELSLKSPEDLIYWARDSGRRDIAALSGLIFQAAELGDEAAQAIIESGANSLVEMASAVLGTADHDRILLTGGVIEGNPGFRDLICRKIRARFPDVSPVAALNKPEVGAALIAITGFC